MWQDLKRAVEGSSNSCWIVGCSWFLGLSQLIIVTFKFEKLFVRETLHFFSGLQARSIFHEFGLSAGISENRAINVINVVTKSTLPQK